MNQVPLYEALKKHNDKGMSSFHTPGHKSNFMQEFDFTKLDLTELDDTDSLYECSGAILEAEKKVSELYGSERTIFSAGGNTLCIQTMIKMCMNRTKKMLAGRVIHRAAVGAMALLDIQPEWLLPSQEHEFDLPGIITSKTVLEKIKKNKNIASVYITSPDYYGMMSEISGISDICKNNDIYFMVDNAHGAHLMFLEKNMHPMSLGATLVADSVHKTLPAFTGGAWLHISDKELLKSAKASMGLFGSTSPSYPIMCSLDMCRAWLEKYGKESFSNLEKRVKKIRQLAVNKGICIPKGKMDPVRITLNVSSIGYTGKEFCEYLRSFGVEPEFSDRNYVVLIPTPFNSEQDFEKLERAIYNVSVREPLKPNCIQIRLPMVKTTIREAIMAEGIVIPVRQCLNRVSVDIVSICPPGIPIVMPGEIIEDDHIEQLINAGISEIKVIK